MIGASHSTAVLLAVLLTFAAGLLVLPLPATRVRATAEVGAAGAAGSDDARDRGVRALWAAGLLAGAALAIIGAPAGAITLSPRLGFGMVVAGCGAAALVLRRRAAGSARDRRLAVSAGEACDLLVGELAAGSPPLVALQRVAAAEPMLQSVAGLGRMGGDVPAALRGLAASSGVSSWQRVADGWEVSLRTGAGLTGVLAQVAAAERDALARRRLVQQELAEAQATARLMAVLPWLLVAAGSVGGGGALSFLTGSWPGVISAAAGCVLATAGLFWLERIERSGTTS